jgi:hypothetical protein
VSTVITVGVIKLDHLGRLNVREPQQTSWSTTYPDVCTPMEATRAIDITLHFQLLRSRMTDRDNIFKLEPNVASDIPSPFRWSVMDFPTPHENKLAVFESKSGFEVACTH